MPTPKESQPEIIPRWLTVLEASAYIHVCPGIIRTLLHNGELKAARIGNHYRIERSDLDQLLTRRKRVVPPYRKGTRPWVAKRWAKKRKATR